MLKPEIIKYPSINDSREKMAMKAMEDYISRNEAGTEIGSGRTAKVKVLEEDPSICMKAIFNKSISLNDAETEMDLLDELSRKGYPVPSPVCSISTTEDDYVFIETIGTAENPKGLSLADLVDRDLIEELPANFDFKRFFNRLNEIVDDLNERENIYHRDLHLGNIMINKDGLPSVIDFGDAERIFGGENPFRRVNAKGEIEIIHRDKDKVTEAYRLVGQYLKDNNWFTNIKKKG